MKKTLLLLVALITATIAFAYDAKIDGIYYNLNDETKTAEVTYQYECTLIGDYSGIITIPEKVTYNAIEYSVTSIGNSAFQECRSLTSITIPNSVTSIGNSAFSYCSSLTSITIPNSVTSIGKRAFEYCTSLTSITIPNSVTSIGEGAFSNCSSLTSITIPNSVTSIGIAAFSSCSSLTSISLPNSVTSIVSNAFYECSSLTSITIPNSVTSIRSYAFSYCKSLTSITIGNGVTSIGKSAFQSCSKITEIHISDIAKWCDIDFEVSNSNPLNSQEASLYVSGNKITELVIPEGVEFIKEYTFYECSSLTSITIPNSVTSIGKEAFCFCDALTSITIGNSVNSVGEYAFTGCRNLTSITCLGSMPPSASDLGTDTKNCTLIVPYEAYNDYSQHAYWGQFSNIETLDTNLYKKLEILVNDTLFGYVNVSSGYYCVNNNITIHAIPNEGYEFNQWSDGNTENPRTICITSDTTITAEFRVASTPIENTSDSQTKIYVTNGTLHIDGLTSDYQIYNISGQLIYRGNETSLQLPRGIYLITMGGEVEKIVL